VRYFIVAVLRGHRPARDIVADARKMRDEIAAHKPAKGPLDAKLLPGGLVDLEFAIHARQLVYRTGFDPHLREAILALTAQGLLPAHLMQAHDFLTRLLVTLRLVAPDAQPPASASRPVVAHAVGASDWDGMVASLDRHRQEVSQAWAAVTDKEA
jgi:glutamate-ammonia-ligase adenylyltransferase